MKSTHILIALTALFSLSLVACGSAGIGSFDVTEESSEAVITGGSGSPLGDFLPVNNSK